MGDINRVAKKLAQAMNESNKRKPTPYDTEANVVRVDGDTIWVKIPGGENETPVRKTIDAKSGDTIMVRISGGRAWATGNATVPPTGDMMARIARLEATTAAKSAAYAKEVADIAGEDALIAKRTANRILIYDHEYTMEDSNTALFTAYLYKGGVDIKHLFEPDCFTWYLKTEDGEQYLGYGYQIRVSKSVCGYGAEIVGYFNSMDDSYVLSEDGSNLSDVNDNPLSVRATGDSIRVRDLSKTTTIYPTDSVMLITAESEKLADIDDFADKIWDILGITIENEPLQPGNNNYEDIGLLGITNLEIDAICTLQN